MPTKTETEYRCTYCNRWAPWTDGLSVDAGDTHDEFWCQTCGAEIVLKTMEKRTR
jgi:DNA-directed RNA polymerase subunit RPC12/RpoP